MRRVFIHLPDHISTSGFRGPQGFYGRLRRAFEGVGDEVILCEREDLSGSALDADGFHFVHQGLVQRENALNTAHAYLNPYWYADPVGVYGFSSLYEAMFDPDDIADNWANGFHRRLHERLVRARVSRVEQPNRRMDLPTGAVAVFLQGPSMIVSRAQYMTELEMVRAVLENAGDRAILVKPHPLNPDPDLIADLKEMQQGWPNLQVVDANLHDILAVADLCCTISSSAALEAMIHQVPVVLFGRTDFHHCAVTVDRADQVGGAFEQALYTPWPFQKFLLWFLQIHQVNMGRKAWFETICERMQP